MNALSALEHAERIAELERTLAGLPAQLAELAARRVDAEAAVAAAEAARAAAQAAWFAALQGGSDGRNHEGDVLLTGAEVSKRRAVLTQLDRQRDRLRLVGDAARGELATLQACAASPPRAGLLARLVGGWGRFAPGAALLGPRAR